MSKKIRDIIHNYVYLTPFEEMITENSLFLRLHYIHQNSFAYLTYPSAHNTRFSHSLGVMHLAGEIFQSAYLRTPATKVSTFLNSVREEFGRLKISSIIDGKFVDVKISKILEEMTSDTSAHFFDNVVYGPFIRSGHFKSLTTHEKENAALSIVFLQALRIAALLHDVGHPPFSHIVEYALLEGLIQRRHAADEVARKVNKVAEAVPHYLGHEHASEKIAAQILSGSTFDRHRFTCRTPHFAATCAAFAQAMFTQDSRLSGIKRTILSGDVDADRIDYVLRDAKSAGMTIDYDIDRLLDAAFLNNEGGSDFEVSYKLGALPAIENFFNARYDLYRWMIYHHDTTRRNLVVQRFLVTLLTSKSVSKPIKDAAKRLEVSATGGENASYSNYRSFLDAYLINMMWEIYDYLDASASLTDTEIQLKMYLSVVLSRNNFIFPTLCKTPGDYAYLAQKTLATLRSLSGDLQLNAMGAASAEDIEALNGAVRKSFDSIIIDLEKELKDRSANRKEIEGIAKYRLALDIEETIQPFLDKSYGVDEYYVYCYYIGTFQASFKNKFLLFPPDGGGGPIEINELSPTVKMLGTAWAKSPQLMIYLRISDQKAREWAEERSETRVAIFTGLRNAIGEALGSYLYKRPSSS